MKIYKDFTKKIEITTVDDWLQHCPPMDSSRQWVPKRSAVEMANFWVKSECQNEFISFLKTYDKDLAFQYAVPEIATKFDNYKNARKNDLCIFASSRNRQVLISIEGKADEPFGDNLFGQQWINSINEVNSSSKKLNRIVGLYQRFDQQNDILKLRYQLTYWLAGSIDEAIRNNIDTVYLIVQEFHSDQTTNKKVTTNKNDLDNFIEFISKSRYKTVEPNKVIGPVSNEFTKNINLFIGKFQKYVD